jgi:uncharacterized membrane protein YfcA
VTLTLAALCGFAFLAGFVDAVVGGGGLIQIPALFVLMPQLPPALLFGTNKFAAVWGTLSAALQYSRRVPPIWRTVLPAALAALLFSFLGAHTVSALNPAVLRPLILALLLLVLGYTLWKKDFGALHAPHLSHAQQLWLGLATGAIIGFYDGFFGPGTGSFFVFLFVRVLGYDFLHASAAAKRLNTATNFAALVLFAWTGHVWWHIAAVLAVANVAGSLLGTRLALARGAGFVRIVFIVVVSALILKTAYDAFFPH